jgi:hypothetical protein
VKWCRCIDYNVAPPLASGRAIDTGNVIGVYLFCCAAHIISTAEPIVHFLHTRAKTIVGRGC